MLELAPFPLLFHFSCISLSCISLLFSRFHVPPVLTDAQRTKELTCVRWPFLSDPDRSSASNLPLIAAGTVPPPDQEYRRSVHSPNAPRVAIAGLPPDIISKRNYLCAIISRAISRLTCSRVWLTAATIVSYLSLLKLSV